MGSGPGACAGVPTASQGWLPCLQHLGCPGVMRARGMRGHREQVMDIPVGTRFCCLGGGGKGKFPCSSPEQPAAGMQSMCRSCSSSPCPSSLQLAGKSHPHRAGLLLLPAQRLGGKGPAALPQHRFLTIWVGGLTPNCSLQKESGSRA